MGTRRWYEQDDNKYLHMFMLGSVIRRRYYERPEVQSPDQKCGGEPQLLVWARYYWYDLHWYLLFLYDTFIFVLRFYMSFLLTFLRFFIIREDVKDIKGDVVVVTGAASGLGKFIALRLAIHGAIVMCLDIDKEKLEDVVTKLREACPRSHPRGFVVDVTDRNAVLNVAEEIKKEIGNVKMLVNCACINPCRFLSHYNHKEISKVVDVNLKAHFWTMEAFLPHMKENQCGQVVCVGSIGSRLGSNHMAPGCASFFGAFGLMEALECDLRFYDYDAYIKLTTAFAYYQGPDGPRGKPRIIFPNWMKHKTTQEAADAIVYGALRNRRYIWVPFYAKYLNYLLQLLPRSTVIAFKDYMEFACDPYDHHRTPKKKETSSGSQ